MPSATRPGRRARAECVGVVETARRLNVSTKTVRRWLTEGYLRGFRVAGVGGQWRIAVEEIERVMGQQR